MRTKYSQIAEWNGEADTGVNETYKVNFGKTKAFAMIKLRKTRWVSQRRRVVGPLCRWSVEGSSHDEELLGTRTIHSV